MKLQALFSSKNKSKTIKMLSIESFAWHFQGLKSILFRRVMQCGEGKQEATKWFSIDFKGKNLL